MRIQSILTLSLFLLAGFPAATRAEAPSDVYADALYAYSTYDVYRPANALGAPDEAYADFQDELAYVTLDMGEGEEGTGDLALTYEIQELGAAYRVEFLDANLNVLQTSSDSFEIYTTETTVAYASTEAYRYVRVTCVEDELWRLDAVTAASVAVEEEEPVAEEEPEPEEPVVEESTPARGMIVKLVDDGDPDTTVDAAVYVVDDNGMRHAFPSETVFHTWYETFDDIAYIDAENLAAYTLGDNVTVRSGTWLVKITTDPKVYAVEPGGVLRWVTTEELAESLYGADWNQRIVDVPDVFWGNYTVGDPITTETHPAGTVGVISTGAVVYLDADNYYTLPGGVYDYMRFQSDFYVSISDEKLAQFDAGGDLSMDPDIAFPY